MSLSGDAFTRLERHWAVASILPGEIDRADRLVAERTAHRAVSQQIAFTFSPSPNDDPFLERIALAYEIAAIEGLDELSRPSGGDLALRQQAVAASFRAFGIRSLMRVPEDTHARLFFVLQLSALAYCGDCWSDLRRWYKDNESSLSAPNPDSATWDCRLLYRIFDCWVSLFRKRDWDDVSRIAQIISDLRQDQVVFEAERLNNGSPPVDRAIALRLAALYHWARATELLARYVLQGQPTAPHSHLDKHFESGVDAAAASGDAQHEVLLRWLHAAANIMVTNSLWWATRNVNSRTTEFVRLLTSRTTHSMFELLPPQRVALLEQGLLDQAKTAIVVDLPTSGGKTLLAQFRILQALNQFASTGGWVAYVAPTRALAAQVTRRLRRDFTPLGLRVEQLTAAIDVDAFEDELLTDQSHPFHVLVATPEKLSLVIRNQRIERPLSLVVMDEAHNIEATGRGLRIELFLATVKRDCPTANFMLLMPFVEDSDSIARWLAHDVHAGRAISLGTTPWKPNERIIGLYYAVPDDLERSSWHLTFETLTATKKAMPLSGRHRVGQSRPLNVPRSRVIQAGKQSGLALQTAAMGVAMSSRGTSVVVANQIRTVWTMAKEAAAVLPTLDTVPEDIRLVQDFLRTEFGPTFELVNLLDKGVGVHHAGLSDDVRTLMEWLAEEGSLRMLCATTTIAQGMNFPVSSVFLQTHKYAYGKEMSPREFWNLAGRAGRLGHDSVGVVGVALGSDRDALVDFVSRSTGALVSRLVTLLNELAIQGTLSRLSEVLHEEQWEDFRCYVAHLWVQKKNLNSVLAETDQLLRQTYGYTTLRNDPAQRDKADALLSATRNYARKLADKPGHAELADSTGFSPEGVAQAMSGMSRLTEKVAATDWEPDSLFSRGSRMADLFGVMLRVPQLKPLEEIGGQGVDRKRISNMTLDWVNGKRIDVIAKKYFTDGDSNDAGAVAISDACRAIYRSIVNSGTWGMSALSRVSQIDFEAMSESNRRRINALPAMIYHGVRSEDAVLMRMNSVPRSAAETLGRSYRDATRGDENRYRVGKARDFLKDLDPGGWERARPEDANLSGAGYKGIWEVLSGEGV